MSVRIQKHRIPKILKRLFHKKDLLLVVGSRRVVSELTLRKIEKFGFKSGWFTCECRDWHLHMRFGEVKRLRFVERKREAGSKGPRYSVIFQGREGHRLLQAYLRQDKKTYDVVRKMAEKD